MRTFLFELVIIFLYLVEGNQEVNWPTSRKSAKKISIEDLKNITMNVESIKKDPVIFEPSKFPQFSQNQTFRYNFKKHFIENPQLSMTLNDVIHLVERGVINETQAIMMWDMMVKNKTAPLEFEFPKFNLTEYFGDLFSQSKNYLGQFPMTLLFAFGFIILLFVYVYLGLTFYVKFSYLGLTILSVIFLYNFYYLAFMTQSQLQSVVFSSFIYNTLFFIAVVLGHSLLCLARLQNDVAKFQEIFDASINFTGKAILSVYSVVLGYIFAFGCNFFIAHFPFYVSMLYFVYIMGKKYSFKLGSTFQPSGIFSVSVYGFLLFCYIYSHGKDSFVPKRQLINFVNQLLPSPLLNADTDLRYAGILISSTVVLGVFPLYLLVQSLGLGKECLGGKFDIKKIFEEVKKAQVKEAFSVESRKKSYWMLVYGILTIVSMYTGFKMHIHFIVILAIFGLQSFNGIYVKEKGISNVIFFYSSGLVTVNAAFLLGQIEDQFSPLIFGEHREGYFVFVCEAIIRMTLNYYAFAICSANMTSQDMGKITSFKSLGLFIFKYFCNYFFAVYLILMAQYEKSVIHSLFYSISAVISFSKVLLYSSSKNDPSTRLLISFLIFLSGLRVSLLSGTLAVPFYFGLLLMNFSVFVTYTTFAHSLSIPIALLYFAGLFSYALHLKSSFLMMLVVVNLCGLVATRIAESKEKMLRIFLTLVGMNMLVVIINKFDFGAYYNIVETVLNFIIPDFLDKFWKRTLEDKDIFEYNFAKSVIDEMINSFK